MPFTKRALGFFRGLARHNEKAWFEAHRDEYESEVRQPMRELIEDLDTRFAQFAPEIGGNPKRSMFRINRDIRFSKDKSPYKTHVACWFFHRDAGHGVGGDAAHGGAGFYVHLSPTESFCGGGIWMPPRPTLVKLRQHLADDYQGFEDIVLSSGFKRRFGALDDEAMLTRMPRGFDPEHPAGKWLRYQSFTTWRDMPKAEFESAKLPDTVAKTFEALVPFIRWLNGALGLKPSTKR